MTDVENTDLLLQYMRIVVRQQDGILEALSSMQRQNDNLSAILAQELVRRNDTPRENNNRVRINRPRTRTFFASTSLPQVRERRRPRIVTHHRTGNTTINIPGMVAQSTNTVSDDILTATMNDSPVRVRPSFAQIRRATRALSFRDISNTTQTICPIDRELLQADDTVLQIISCGHFFRDSNLRRHFRGNTRCPLCRYDIRDYIPTLEETTYTFPNMLIRRRPPPLPPLPPPPPPPGPPPPFFNDLENPFETLPSTNINPSQQTTQEIQSALGEAITNILDSSGNIL
jgi:hypothetical protein